MNNSISNFFNIVDDNSDDNDDIDDLLAAYEHCKPTKQSINDQKMKKMTKR